VYIYIYIFIYAYAHIYICISTTRACVLRQRCSSFFAMEAIANLSWVLREHLAISRSFPPALLPLRRAGCPSAGPLPDAVRLRNSSISTIAHDAVATVVLYKLHPIIRVVAGFIQFVYGSHSRMAADLTPRQKSIFAAFLRAFINLLSSCLFLFISPSSYPVAPLASLHSLLLQLRQVAQCFCAMSFFSWHRLSLCVFV